MKSLVAMLAGLAATAMGWSGAPAQRAPLPSQAVQQVGGVRTTPAAERGRVVPGRFIVLLEPRADPQTVAREHGVQPKYVYTTVVTGFAGPISDLARSGLLRDSRVRKIEPVRLVRATATANSWGIDRIDQRALPLNGSYAAGQTGSGVTAYVVDSGIRLDHVLFGGRAARGIDVIGDGQNGSDCNGHGTHVAGTIGAGSGYGVAPGIKLVSARVLDCDGSGLTSGVIAALDWIARNGHRPAVVNMSIGGDPDPPTDEAVGNLISAGFTVVIAAGNDDVDACQTSPGRVPAAITVGATAKSDSRTSWSNYGSCLDLFAPGDGIVSAYNSSSTALAQMSGTSMAAPHVTGASALVLQATPSASPASVRNTLFNSATKSIVTSAASANDDLLFVGAATSESPTPTTGGVKITGTTGDDVVSPTRTVSGQPLPTAKGDTIYGLAGNDRLDGGGGGDRMEGGPGNDVMFVNDAADVVVEKSGEGSDEVRSSVTYTLPANVERLRLLGTARLTGRGNSLANVLYANAAGGSLVGEGGNDNLIGGAAGDNLYGRDGTDILRGNGGFDRFRFDSALNASTNVDTIADFVPGQDKIYLSTSVFTGAAGTLPATAFTIGTGATAAAHRIIYDAGTGNLYYDADGTGPAVRVRFAKLTAGLALKASDFVLY